MLLFVALMLMAFLALFAIAVDIGLWLNTRAEAQRVADAAALAGAGVYHRRPLSDGNGNPVPPPDSAEVADTARDYATRNYVGHDAVDGADLDQVTVDVTPAERRVRVSIRGGTSSLFANFIGTSFLRVNAMAEARVMDAISSNCVKPWAIPDYWDDKDGDGQFSEGDEYVPYMPGGDNTNATGYGSDFKQDTTGFGAQLTLLYSSPEGAVVPSIALPFQMPEDPVPLGNEICGNDKSGNEFKANICGCNDSEILTTPDSTYELLASTTARKGIVKDAVQKLIDADPNAVWADGGTPDHPITGVAERWGHWMNSPRVIRVALFDPAQLANIVPGGNNRIHFGNIALFFIENMQMQALDASITGRFIGYPPPGIRTGVAPGKWITTLQLVK